MKNLYKALFWQFFKCNLLILLSTYFLNLTFYECINYEESVKSPKTVSF